MTMRNANPSPGGNSENVVFGDRTRVLDLPPVKGFASLNFASQNVPPLTGITPDIPLPYRGGERGECKLRLGYGGVKGAIGESGKTNPIDSRTKILYAVGGTSAANIPAKPMTKSRLKSRFTSPT